MSSATLLILNSGSSSIRFALHAAATDGPAILAGHIEGIGLATARFHAHNPVGEVLSQQEWTGSIDHAKALARLFTWLETHSFEAGEIVGAGHRVVHGGDEFTTPVVITPVVRARLAQYVDLAPLHQPHNLAGIDALSAIRGQLPQVACFDVAFHRTLPRVAYLTGLPRGYADEGLRVYGFHGISCEYVMAELEHLAGAEAAHGRVIIAHLGNGASMTAVKEGQSIDTTMGFTPLAGLIMGTRCGDVDPGLILHLLEKRGISTAALSRLLQKQSGLLGISGVSSSMAALLQACDVPAAREAVELFCYRARRYLGALCASLGGLDHLVFTGGIGENAAEIREQICRDLNYLGICLDPAHNRVHAPWISDPAANVGVHVIPTDEGRQIARHTRGLLELRNPAGSVDQGVSIP